MTTEKKVKVSLTKEEIEDLQWALIANENGLRKRKKCPNAQKRMGVLWSKLYEMREEFMEEGGKK